MNVERAVLLLAGLILLSCGTAPLELAHDDSTQGGSPLLDGAEDPGHKFDVGICSGGLVPEGQPNAGTCARAKCSGTLIAPNLILTARHCIRKVEYAASFCESVFTDASISTAAVLVTTSPSVKLGSPKWYSVKAELVPDTKNLCTDDVALLVLDSAVPLREAFPVPVNVNRDVSSRKPTEVAIVGRGVISEVLDLETGETKSVDGDLKRRVLEHIPFVCATNNGSRPCETVDYSSPPSNVFMSPPSYLIIGKGVARGDSGSAVFDQATFSWLPIVIGVTSASTYGPDGVPNHGLIARLDIHRDFILKGLQTAASSLFLNENAFIGQAR